MVAVCAVVCYFLLWLDALRQYMYVYGTCFVFVCGKVCCVTGWSGGRIMA